jgi:hypothetical protein
MTSSLQQGRPALTVSRDDARSRMQQQIDRAEGIPNVSILENHEAERWYDYTAELLRQVCSTDELTDEFTGRGTVSFGGGDISVGRYVQKLRSILERLDLYPEALPEPDRALLRDPLVEIERIASRFHVIVRQLRQRHDNRTTLDVNDEYDAQDLLHALLRLYFDDIRPEEWTPSYAGGSSRMDFLLRAERIVVEVKKTRSGLGAKQVGEQLSIDVVRYRSHPDCECLVCLVYDPEERIPNPKGLEQDFEQLRDGIDVKVYVVQR